MPADAVETGRQATPPAPGADPRSAMRGWHPNRGRRDLAAKGSEYALYALLLAQPVLGLLQTNARGDRVDLFFLGQLPALIGQDRPLAWQLLAVHETVGFLLLGLIALHISAALFHHFWRRDDTLAAMLPSAAGHRQTGPRALAISVQSPSSRRGLA